MSRFMFVYHGGKAPESPEEGAKVMAEWQAWFGTMGAALLEPGGPAGMSKTVTKSGVAENGGANPVSGLTIVEAADQGAAVKLAKGCPMVKDGSGSVEVAEILQM